VEKKGGGGGGVHMNMCLILNTYPARDVSTYKEKRTVNDDKERKFVTVNFI